MEINWLPSDLADDLVRLDPMLDTDFERIYAVASDPLIWELHPDKERYKREVFWKFFEAGKGKGYLIIDQQSQTVAGSTRFYNYDPGDHSVAIGFTFLALKFWGGQYNRSVKKLMLDYAFQYVDKVYFHIGPDNIRSIKATSKLGAKYDCMVDFDRFGTIEPHLQYTLSKEDYYNQAKEASHY